MAAMMQSSEPIFSARPTGWTWSYSSPTSPNFPERSAAVISASPARLTVQEGAAAITLCAS